MNTLTKVYFCEIGFRNCSWKSRLYLLNSILIKNKFSKWNIFFSLYNAFFYTEPVFAFHWLFLSFATVLSLFYFSSLEILWFFLWVFFFFYFLFFFFFIFILLYLLKKIIYYNNLKAVGMSHTFMTTSIIHEISVLLTLEITLCKEYNGE